MLDLNMPGKDGREALRELKSMEAFQKIPTIVFTTSSSDRDKQMAYESGANCFVTKPDTFNKLVEVTGCILKLWLPEE
jgi:CheY-like chemotaxis protein